MTVPQRRVLAAVAEGYMTLREIARAVRRYPHIVQQVLDALLRRAYVTPSEHNGVEVYVVTERGMRALAR